MSVQPSLFGDPLPSQKREPVIVQERRRLNAAAKRVLARLQEGAATNVELSRICLRFGGRIFELRQDGWVIEDVRPKRGGMWVYKLIGRK